MLKRQRKEPVRLHKKTECDDNYFKFITCLIKKPEFWLIIAIIIIGLLLTYIAFKEGISSMYYNTGIKSATTALIQLLV